MHTLLGVLMSAFVLASAGEKPTLGAPQEVFPSSNCRLCHCPTWISRLQEIQGLNRSCRRHLSPVASLLRSYANLLNPNCQIR
jgi:hypothetical protein